MSKKNKKESQLVNEQDLEQKIVTARKKYQKDLSHNPTDKGVAFNFITDMIAGAFVGFLIGSQLDKFFATKPLFIILFLIIGIAVGFYIFYKDNFLKTNKDQKDA
jgi:ATP synthase protein I